MKCKWLIFHSERENVRSKFNVVSLNAEALFERNVDQLINENNRETNINELAQENSEIVMKAWHGLQPQSIKVKDTNGQLLSDPDSIAPMQRSQ